MATQTVPHPASNRHLFWNLALWPIQIGLAFLFLQAGLLKVTGNPMMVSMFGVVGLGQWFRYLTGLLELAGSIGLLIPGLNGYAALLLSAVMAGAVLTHLAILGGSPLLPLALLAASLIVAWGRLGRKI